MFVPLRTENRFFISCEEPPPGWAAVLLCSEIDKCQISRLTDVTYNGMIKVQKEKEVANMKRLLMCLLVLLCLSALAVNAQAAEGESGWEFDEETQTLYIYGEGSTADFKYNGWTNMPNLRHVVIGEGITVIGENAFYNCYILKTVQMPSTLKEIGDSAFLGTCVTEIVVPEGVTKIGKKAFADCKVLKSIQLPSTLTEIDEGAFCNSGLTECRLPKNIKKLNESVFASCKSLTNVVLNDGLTEIDRFVFEKCSLLKTITIPNSVTTIGELAFWQCTGLTSIYIPDSVTFLGGRVFCECTALETVRLSHKLAYIYNSLVSDCSALKTVEIPDSVEKLGTAFDRCKALEEIYIGSGVQALNYHHFDGCEQLKKINISPKNKRYTSVDGIVYSKDMTVLELVPEGFEGVLEVLPGTLEVQREAGTDLPKLTAVVIPDSVTFIGGNAFMRCDNIETVVLGSGVEELDSNVFCDCNKLKNLTLNDGLKVIGYGAFSSCWSLESVRVPASVTRIESNAFQDCRGLKRIEFLGDKPKFMSDVFMYTWAEAYHPEGNTTWDDGRLDYGGYLIWPQDPSYQKYSGTCGVLLKWELDPNTGVLTISGKGQMGAFSNNLDPIKDQIKEVVIQEGVLTMGQMFDLVHAKKITLPASVRQIEDKAFYRWTALEHVEILGDGVVLGSVIFFECPAIKTVRFTGNMPVAESSMVFSGFVGTIYYPANNPTWDLDNWIINGAKVIYDEMTCVAEGEAEPDPKPPVTEPQEQEKEEQNEEKKPSMLIWLLPVLGLVIAGASVTAALLWKKK